MARAKRLKLAPNSSGSRYTDCVACGRPVPQPLLEYHLLSGSCSSLAQAQVDSQSPEFRSPALLPGEGQRGCQVGGENGHDQSPFPSAGSLARPDQELSIWTAENAQPCAWDSHAQAVNSSAASLALDGRDCQPLQNGRESARWTAMGVGSTHRSSAIGSASFKDSSLSDIDTRVCPQDDGCSRQSGSQLEGESRRPTAAHGGGEVHGEVVCAGGTPLSHDDCVIEGTSTGTRKRPHPEKEGSELDSCGRHLQDSRGGSDAKPQSPGGRANPPSSVPSTPRPFLSLFRRPTKTLHLIRHAHTSFFPNNPWTSPPAVLPSLGASQTPIGSSSSSKESTNIDVRLSARGLQQARDLHCRLMSLASSADVILVSPLTRALQTLCLALEGAPRAPSASHSCPHHSSQPLCSQPGESRNVPEQTAKPCSSSEESCRQNDNSEHVTGSKMIGELSGATVPKAVMSNKVPHHWRECRVRNELLGSVPVRVTALLAEHVATPGDVGRPIESVRREFDLPWLDFSGVSSDWWHGPSSAPDGAVEPSFLRRESKDSFRKRVAMFREHVWGSPYSKIVVLGHSTFFMELMGTQHRMANCQDATMRI